ncbi:MAG: MFS transporter [Phycisphaerales bacterium]|nr:MFS transporter [Phycisphaerales bacterium]
MATEQSVSLSQRPVLRAIVLCALYFAQGLPYGFASIAVAAALTKHGATAAQIASLLATVLLPWTFKWAWGPLIDRFSGSAMGRRRPWILAAQSLMVLSVLGLAFGPDPIEHQSWLLGMLLLTNIACSLQDVSVDALAVDQLTEAERGRVNGFMWGSNITGLAVGGALLGAIAASAGLRMSALVLAVFIAAIMLLPLLVRERQGERLAPWTQGHRCASAQPPPGSALLVVKRLLRAFSLRSTLLAVLLALSINMTIGLLGSCSPGLLIQHLNWSQESYSSWMGSIAFVGLAGALLGGFLADRYGPRRIAAIGGLGLAGCYLSFSLLSSNWGDQGFVIGYMVVETIFSGMLSVALFSMFMSLSWPLVAATQFTAYMAMLNLSRLIGTGLVTTLVGEGPDLASIPEIWRAPVLLQCAWDYHIDYLAQMKSLWATAALMQAAPLLLLPFIDPGQARRALGGDEAQDDVFSKSKERSAGELPRKTRD